MPVSVGVGVVWCLNEYRVEVRLHGVPDDLGGCLEERPPTSTAKPMSANSVLTTCENERQMERVKK